MRVKLRSIEAVGEALEESSVVIAEKQEVHASNDDEKDKSRGLGKQ